jgi:hypothetical protein
MKRIVILAALAAIVLSISVTPAIASNPPSLTVTAFHGPGSTAAWVNVGSAAETGSFVVSISTTLNSFGGVVYHGVKGLTPSLLPHLGFDIKVFSTNGGSPAFGAGAPRLSIGLSNGVTLFPDPFYCSDISGSASSGSYVHFDVVTDAMCTVFASTSGTTPVGAWSDVLTLYGSVPISSIIMVQDNPFSTFYLGTIIAGCASIVSPPPSSMPILGSC